MKLLWCSWILVLCPVMAVVSPLERLTDEVKAMQETVNSIQASLMTSVGLIQDQVQDLSQKLTAQFDDKLVSLDKKLDTVINNMGVLQERAGQWENLQPHIQLLSTTVSQIDQKVDKFTRLHHDQISEHSRSSEFRQEGMSRKLGQLGSQLQVLDSRILDVQDKVLAMPEVSSGLRNLTARLGPHTRLVMRRHRGNSNSGSGPCHDTKDLIETLSSKVDKMMETVSRSDSLNSVSGPSFEFLRADPPNGQDDIIIDHDGDVEIDLEDSKMPNVVRQIVVPYRKATKKLRAIEEEQGKMATTLQLIQSKVDDSFADLNRKFGDFKVLAADLSHEQTHLIENFGKDLAAILQCCKGHSVDYSRFIASASPVIDRLDSWMVTWRGEVAQGLDRISQQQSYNSGRLEDSHKQLERLLLEGLDSCTNEAVNLPGKRATTTTTTSSPTTESTTQPTMETGAQVWAHDDIPVKLDCSQIQSDGFTEKKVYQLGRVRDINLAGRDYYTRLCDLETDGGGWTIIQNRGDYGEPRENFNSTWRRYKEGFGSLQGEFWFGNDYISRLTAERPYSLRIELEAWDGRSAYAEYSTFRVDDETSDFRLWVGDYSGNASDSLSVHNGYKFSTSDRNNDNAPECCPCAPAYGGGWWFYSCFESNLNGDYYTDPTDNSYYRGIIWELWLGDYSLKSSRMMIRPRDWMEHGSTSIPFTFPPDP